MQNLPEFSPCKQRLLWHSEEETLNALREYLARKGVSLLEEPGTVQVYLHFGGHFVRYNFDLIYEEIDHLMRVNPSLGGVPVYVDSLSCMGNRRVGYYAGFQVELST